MKTHVLKFKNEYDEKSYKKLYAYYIIHYNDVVKVVLFLFEMIKYLNSYIFLKNSTKYTILRI